MNLDLGNGFHLTELRRSDEEAVVEGLNDREFYDNTSRIPFPYTAEDARRWIAFNEEATELNGQPVLWAIRDPEGKLIGSIGLEGVDAGKSHRAELGYWLAKLCRGQGVMTAAVRAVCRHAFENLGLVKIAAHVFSFNEPSARVLERCGFRLEGLLRKQFMKDGEYIDSKLYSLEKDAASESAPPAVAAAAPNGLTIRPYREADEEQVIRLWQTVFTHDPPWRLPEADIRRKLTMQRDLFLVGEVGGEVVATVMAGFDGHRGWINRMAVAPAFQRRGFGEALLIEAERRLRHLGCPKVNLQVLPANQAVIAFYRSLGYETEDRISMGKRLDTPGG